MKTVSIVFLASILSVSGLALAESVGSLPELSGASLRALKTAPVETPQPFPAVAAPQLPVALAGAADVAAALKTMSTQESVGAQPLSLGQPRSPTGSLELNLPPSALSALAAASSLKVGEPEASVPGSAPTLVLLGVPTRKGSERAVMTSPWLGETR